MKGFGSNKQSFKDNSNLFDRNRLIIHALELHQKGNTQEAKRLYQKILKKGIADPRVFTNLGVIFQIENDYENIAQRLQKETSETFTSRRDRVG